MLSRLSSLMCAATALLAFGCNKSNDNNATQTAAYRRDERPHRLP